MANPYTYGADGSLDQRWVDEYGSTTDRLNVARKMCDYLKSALSSFMDPDLTAVYGTWENPQILAGATGLYTWYDATNDCKRETSGAAPVSEIDGIISGGGGATP